MPKPLVEPVTVTSRPVREPVIVMVGRGGAWGVTALDGADGIDQPAPLRARTVKVYAVVLVSPATVQVSVEVKQERPPGDAVAWYIEIG